MFALTTMCNNKWLEFQLELSILLITAYLCIQITNIIKRKSHINANYATIIVVYMISKLNNPNILKHAAYILYPKKRHPAKLHLSISKSLLSYS